MNTFYSFLAMGPASGGQGGNQSPLTFPVMMILFFAIMYVMMIRPQQRKEKERRAMLDELKKGDKVLFAGGLIGVIAQIDGKTAKIKVADNLRLEVARGSISAVITDEQELIDPVQG
jgi:preprotein translocase subunit YajC